MSKQFFSVVTSKLSVAVCAVTTLALLSGCASKSEEDLFDPPLHSAFSVKSRDVILVRPNIAEREQYQLLITQLTQLLSESDTTAEQRAQILFQLGVCYDRLGLEVTARTMFMSALVEVPDYADAYNFLGIYLTSAERFNEAYEAYDSVIEINPKDLYAYFNRGIALYYGGRAKLGISDILKFYEADKNDPFRMAWLYLLEREVFGQEIALGKLALRREAIDKIAPWGHEILDFFEGKRSGSQVIESIRQADIKETEVAGRLCEAYFYLAKEAEHRGEYKEAYDLFNLCITTNVTGYLEYRYALMEMQRFEREEQVVKATSLAKKFQSEQSERLTKQAEEAHKFFEDLRKGQAQAEQEVDKQTTAKAASKTEPTTSEADASKSTAPNQDSKHTQASTKNSVENSSDPTNATTSKKATESK